ncbi:hypothetical protein [Actinomadura madurae]|uniref:hypothetical protein n=1 Tax=Actinomadura madurae TaxID=1993 RepID=UPI002026A79A|nr:hypothetical protein [Actinomadura madurae]MCP9955694.1 hypothetical protein [Actinomadura madurae]MCP9972426.1 hypothetical protein [Actinomadura madurae]MCP9984939.1 hypothetical protein [Actinomadura madurae]MCQ0003503.1 hypothetical protein [Actinomadura madurae]MCQ0021134.1 hypothetical protein [Actinomadura madurae]
MNKIGLALRQLHHNERGLAQELLRVSERHVSDHEIHHVARDLSAWSQRHLHQLTEMGGRYGARLSTGRALETGLGAMLREKTSELGKHRSAPGLLLLHDLRQIHVQAAGVSIDWEIIAQAAQGSHDTELLELAERCHPDTLRQMRWANAHLKQVSAQVLNS